METENIDSTLYYLSLDRDSGIVTTDDLAELSDE
jgi:hypothetical protein